MIYPSAGGIKMCPNVCTIQNEMHAIHTYHNSNIWYISDMFRDMTENSLQIIYNRNITIKND